MLVEVTELCLYTDICLFGHLEVKHNVNFDAIARFLILRETVPTDIGMTKPSPGNPIICQMVVTYRERNRFLRYCYIKENVAFIASYISTCSYSV